MPLSSGIVSEEILQADPSPLERLSQGGALHVARMVRNGKVDEWIDGMREVVMASLDVIEEVAGVLERANDFTGPKRRDARAHPGLEGHRYPLGNGTPEPRCPLDWHTLSVLPQHLEIPGDGLPHSCSRLDERVTFGNDPWQQRDGDGVAAFDSRLEQYRVGINGALHNPGSGLSPRHDNHLQFESCVQRREARAAGQLCPDRYAQGTDWRFLNELKKELKG